jgi:aspartyl-tRNA(Asn)/glutamyl-tRNA(Gln) amidotransferase subunit B
MKDYEATIGLEVHAEVNTKTKMFCDSLNDPNETRPNINVCPVCLAHPGTLPVINKEAVRHVLRVGMALGSTLADYSEFDRKNYFYPDLPKGYQISQFEYPLVIGGMLNGVAITRVHLEEDTASSVHDEAGEGVTLIDYNRAGVPLMELVTEPVMHSAEEAGTFGRELQLLLRYLGVSEANMEKGQMRVEANVSVAPKGERSAAYVEIKNLNSFRAMERAIEYEIKRQTELLERGESPIKQTLGWDESKQVTFPQRTKEGSADYRYFPDPDLPSLRIGALPELSRDELQKSIPELPNEKRARYIGLGIKPDDADLYVKDSVLGPYFEDFIKAYVNKEMILLASNYIVNDLVKIMRDSETVAVPVSIPHMASIMKMLLDKKISTRSAKDLLGMCTSDVRDPAVVAEEKGLFQNTSSEQLERIVGTVIVENFAVVNDYKGGKTSALEYLVGQSMKALRGAADPAEIRALLVKKMS